MDTTTDFTFGLAPGVSIKMDIPKSQRQMWADALHFMSDLGWRWDCSQEMLRERMLAFPESDLVSMFKIFYFYLDPSRRIGQSVSNSWRMNFDGVLAHCPQSVWLEMVAWNMGHKNNIPLPQCSILYSRYMLHKSLEEMRTPDQEQDEQRKI